MEVAAGPAPERRLSQIRGGAGNYYVSNRNSFTGRPFETPGPGRAIWEVPGRWSESELGQGCEWAELHETLHLPREKLSPISGGIEKMRARNPKSNDSFYDFVRFRVFSMIFGSGRRPGPRERIFRDPGGAPETIAFLIQIP